jgi:tetraacyldisaccharide 4'-kinase
LERVDLKVLTRRARPATASNTISNAVVTTPMLGDAVSLGTGERRTLQSFIGSRVHAIAGIGNPQAFFDALAGLGLSIDAHPLPDHARLTEADLAFPDDAPVLMTEKDAVKCPPGAAASRLANCWAVRLDIAIGEADTQVIDRLLDRILVAH